MKRFHMTAAVAGLLIAAAGCTPTAQNAADGGGAESGAAPPASASFAADIQPIIASRCATCHVEETKGQLSLASLDSAKAGGKNGPSVIPGDSAGSPLYLMVSGQAEKRMPPKGDPLSDAEIATIKAWIDSGAN